MFSAFLMLLQDIPNDPVVIDKTTTWIGLASVVLTMVFSIVRQELAARRVTREARATKIEVQEKVAAVSEKMDEQQQETVQHRQRIKEEVTTAIIDAASMKSNQYQDAAQWRRYVDERIDNMAVRLNEVANCVSSLETFIQSADSKLDDLKQEFLDRRLR
jgi:hypothetical protein